MDLNELLNTMVGQFDGEALKAQNNSHYFKGAADGLRKFAEEAGKLEAEKAADNASSSEPGSVEEVQAAE